MADQDQQESDRINYWDIFRKDVSTFKIPKTSKAADSVFRCVKVIVYVLLFLLVFGGTIVSRGSLQVLTNQLQVERSLNYQENLSKDAISYYLLFIIAIPDGINFLLSFMRFVFGRRTTPSLIQLIVLMIKEGLHMFCLSTIVFKVLPLFNPIEACAYLSGMPLIPTILHSISYRRKCMEGKVLKQLGNIVSILVQLGAVCAVPVIKLINEKVDVMDVVLMIVCGIFFSVRWIETYFKYPRSSFFRKIFAYDKRAEMHTTATLATSTFRLALVMVLFPTFLASGVKDPREVFSSSGQSIRFTPIQQDITNNTNILNGTLPMYVYKPIEDWLLVPFLVHFFTSMGLFYSAVISTRLCMDKICFCIALTFATPAYVVSIFVSLLVGNGNWVQETLIKSEDSGGTLYATFVIFLVVWASQLWTCRHIWYSIHDRMAFTAKLFVLPHYCSPVADLSLLHSRRLASSLHLEDNYKPDDNTTSKVYICATMWHENRTEMKQILNTIFRLDMDQAARSIAKTEVSTTASTESVFAAGLSWSAVQRDYYDFEVHVMFDDAMETVQKDGKSVRQPNEFVQQLMEVIPESATDVFKVPINLNPPNKLITPYGGQIIWILPGQNKLVVHLKDKDKIRHKKRWSQIMYLYYLIGYKLVQKGLEDSKQKLKDTFDSSQSIFENFPDKLIGQAENTYIMALDGDVDFSPEALQLLIDRMKKNPKVGATCGRIKPGGSGPVVWYQKFEYAIGHWLQKSAEHVFGCVLCSPGCFSLFRAKALMDDNIMRMYASLPTEPKHYLQYDQGEDRWLCTLMLQQGYRIEYCAAAEAFTFAPEDFREFFNQRRRWMPSTMANILDLLLSYKTTTRNNSNISYLYIFYQVVLFLSSILGPSTVLLAMQSAVRTVFGTSAVVAYLLTYAPTIIFIFICLKFKSPFQLLIAMILSAIYAMLMMAVIVGTVVNIAQEGVFTPSAVFMYVLIGIFLLAGLFHPHELTDLFWGLLYFICIPAGYLFLSIYAICNLNNVSWGTRETQKAVLERHEGKTPRKKKADEELGVVSQEVIEDILKQAKSTKIKDLSCKDLLPSIFQWINNLVVLRSLESVVNISKNTVTDDGDDDRSQMGKSIRRVKTRFQEDQRESVDDTIWADENNVVKHLHEKEIAFWRELVENYLKPLEADNEKEKAVATSLKDFRNKIAFAFFFVNGLWLVIMSAMNEVRYVLNIKITIDNNTISIEPLGLIFIVIFAILLIMQFIGMIRHRYGTFLLILSTTNLRQISKDPEVLVQKIKSLIAIPEIEFRVQSNRKPGVKPKDEIASVEDVDDIYENFEQTYKKRPKDMGKSFKKRPMKGSNDQPMDFRKTWNKVKGLKQRNRNRPDTNEERL